MAPRTDWNPVLRDELDAPYFAELRAFVAARAEPARARKLIEGLLSAIRMAGLVGDGASGENLDRLRRALGGAGWYLSTDGHLQAFAGVDLYTGGREALD